MLVIRRGPATSGNGHRNLLETLVMKKRGSICKMNLNFYNRACWAGSVENCLGDETAKPEASPIGGKVAFRSAKVAFVQSRKRLTLQSNVSIVSSCKEIFQKSQFAIGSVFESSRFFFVFFGSSFKSSPLVQPGPLW